MEGTTGLAAPRPICEPANQTFESPPDAFDFLVGHWSVLVAGDDVAQIRVVPIFDGKVLELVWTSHEGSYEARAFIGLDVAGRFSQTWVDSSTKPFFLFYHGGVEDGIPTLYQTEMYHESAMFGRQDQSGNVCARQRFMKQTDGTVVYTWELSTNQGESWLVQDRSIFPRRYGSRLTFPHPDLERS